MTATIARRLEVLEAARPPREARFILFEPDEAPEDALLRHGLDPAALPRFLVVVPKKRGRPDADD